MHTLSRLRFSKGLTSWLMYGCQWHHWLHKYDVTSGLGLSKRLATHHWYHVNRQIRCTGANARHNSGETEEVKKLAPMNWVWSLARSTYKATFEAPGWLLTKRLLVLHTVFYVWSLKFARIVFSPQQHTTKQHCCECEEILAIYRQCSEIYRWIRLYEKVPRCWWTWAILRPYRCAAGKKWPY